MCGVRNQTFLILLFRILNIISTNVQIREITKLNKQIKIVNQKKFKAL